MDEYDERLEWITCLGRIGLFLLFGIPFYLLLFG